MGFTYSPEIKKRQSKRYNIKSAESIKNPHFFIKFGIDKKSIRYVESRNVLRLEQSVNITTVNKPSLIFLWMFNRFFIFNLIAICTSVLITAQTPQLDIMSNNGASKYFILDETTKLTFSHDSLYIKSANHTDILKLSQVKSYRFSLGTDNIIMTPDDGDYMRIENKTLIYFTRKDGSSIIISNPQGQIIHRFKANANEENKIPLGSLPHGIYIISANALSSIKVVL